MPNCLDSGRLRRLSVREAGGGTLRLGEIGELAPEVQAKLPRFPQQGEVQPVGADRPVKTGVRAIAATNRNLEADIRAGSFRADLYERFRGLPLHVPPLRERREEIPLFIEYFFGFYQQQERKPGLRLSDEALELMFGYDWPRNVRQLENEALRLVLQAGDDEVIGAAALSPEIGAVTDSPPASSAAIVGGNAVVDLSLPLRDAMNEVKRLFIIHALDETGGNLSQAATRMKMSSPGFEEGEQEAQD